MKFKVKTGVFSAKVSKKTVVRYRAGDIIITDKPLDQLFKNQFERLDDNARVRDSHEGGKGAVPATSEPRPVGEDGPKMTLAPVHRGRGRWDVCKVVDGVVTDESINDAFLTEEDAKAMVEAGLPVKED